jgi:hypothetical protein
LAADRRLNTNSQFTEGVQNLFIALFIGQRVEINNGPVELGINIDGRNGDKGQAFVVDTH